MGVGTLGMILTSPGQTNTVSIFIEHIIEDLNISRSLISTLYAAGTLAGGFSLPFWGKKIDQHGTRKIVTFVAVLFGFACIYMGFARAVGAVIWPSFFGREHLGSIYGVTSAVTIFGAALGPLPFGFAFDLTGSYQLVLLVFAGVSMLFTLTA